VPLIAQATGFPQVSSLRSKRDSEKTFSNISAAHRLVVTLQVIEVSTRQKKYFGRGNYSTTRAVFGLQPRDAGLEIIKKRLIDRIGGLVRVVEHPNGHIAFELVADNLVHVESPLTRPSSNALDNGGRTHTRTDAKRRETGAEIASFHLIEQGAKNHRARRTERMTHGDGATIDVDFIVRDR